MQLIVGIMCGTLLTACGGEAFNALLAREVAFTETGASLGEDAGTARVTLALDVAATAACTIPFTIGGTATPGDDFVAPASPIVIPEGARSIDVALTVIDDTADEPDETIEIQLGTPSGATLGKSTSYTITIIDNDPPPTPDDPDDPDDPRVVCRDNPPAISIADAAAAEEQGTLAFAVSLSAPAPVALLIPYVIHAGTASYPEDIGKSGGVLTLAAGATAGWVSVPLVDDNIAEGDETFSVMLLATDCATLAHAEAQATIVASDTPTLSIAPATSAESAGAQTFMVTLSNPSSVAVFVTAATSDATAHAPSDYAASTLVLAFAPGETTAAFPVGIVDDGRAEADETYIVHLTEPVAAIIGASEAVGTITDDDPVPTATLSGPARVQESAATLTLTVTLSGPSELPVSVDFALDPASTAAAGVDYALATPTTAVLFSPEITTGTIPFDVIDDDLLDGDKALIVTLTGATNATLGTPARQSVSIIDDERSVRLIGARTLDADGNGWLDHIELTFSEPVADATFPGFVMDGLGETQTQWRIAGAVDVTLAHGAAAPEPDIANDAILYLAIDESDALDTGALPEVTTTSTPALFAVSGLPVEPVGPASVTESDGAPPVLLAATTEPGLASLYVFFSEPVASSGGCPGGSVDAAAMLYADESESGVAAITGGSDANGCDGRVVVTAAAGVFTEGDLYTDTITPDPGLLADAAGLAPRPEAVVITGIIHPYVLQVTSADNQHVRLQFSEPMNATQALTLTNYTYADGGCDPAPTLSTPVALDSTTYEFTTSPQGNCPYRLAVTGDVRDANEDAALVDPKFGTFEGNAVLRVISARALSLRSVLVTFSKDVQATGSSGADNLALYTLSSPLGPVTDAVRYDVITGVAADANKIRLTHTHDQGAGFYLVIVSEELQTADGDESLAPEPLDRAAFQGLAGSITDVSQGPVFTDPFADGTTFAFVFSHAGKVYGGPNDNNNSVFRFDPDGQNPIIVRFATSSAKSGGPFASFGANLTRPSTVVTGAAGGGTRYYLTAGTDLSPYHAGVAVTVAGCSAAANNRTDAASAVDDTEDFVELPGSGASSTNETCEVSLYNNAGPGDFDGVDAFVSATVGGQEYLVFGGHNLGGGNFREIYFTTDTDDVLDNAYCDVTPVTLGNTQSLQSILGFGSHLYIGFASDRSFQPLFATLTLPAGGGTCPALSNKVTVPNKEARQLAYLGAGGSPSNPAANIGVDSMAVVVDQSGSPALYIANNGGIAASADLPPTGTTSWIDVRHDGDGVFSGTTQTIPGIGKLRPGDKGVPLMTAWGGYLFVARNRSDGGGVAELWRYDAAPGVTTTPPSTAERWLEVLDTAESGVGAENRDLSLLVVNGDRLYVGFDNAATGAELYRTRAGVTPATLTAATDLELVGSPGLGPVGATDLERNQQFIGSTSVTYDGKHYLYMVVGCLSDLRDNSPCDRDRELGATDFAARIFRQVD